MDDEDDVHSDEEFSFVDEKRDYIPTAGQSGNHGNLSIRLSTGLGAGEGISIPGNVLNSVPDLGDTDFVKMMEDFQGFGSTPKISVPEPPDVSAVLIAKNLDDQEAGDEKSKSQSAGKLDKITDSEVVEFKASGSAISGDNSSENKGEELMESSRNRIASHGQYVKLQDAQEEARAIGEALDAAYADDRPGETSPGNDVTPDPDSTQPGSDVYDPPNYVELVNSRSTPTTNVFDSDSDNDTANNESHSVFSTSASGGAQSPVGEEKKPKGGKMKSRLPFPVLLVTAGEGHSDLRKKKPDLKNTDPRIMIWQIN